MTFSTWGEGSNSPVQGLHAAWGLGFAFGPLVIRPFLGPDRDDNNYNNTNFTTTMSPFNTTSEPEQESRIEIAYLFTAAIVIVLAIISFVLYAVGLPNGVTLHLKAKSTFKSVFSIDGLTTDGNRAFAIQILVLFALFYFGNAGREGVFNTWLFNYAITSELKFSKQEAALLDAASKFSFLGGRVLAALLAIKIPIQPMLITEVRDANNKIS